ncbi:phosphomannomutase / phosphoglucomutase [Atopomonas hussainii]|uniref:phosphomannomutase n=2 Tax=Atopomonas hussainii TaxID=1429083 RepID=A0A1H7NDL9_9GAMM|nr:phosphomannomutase / phosphoglucomutase [Atopomonas hussainii]
MKLKRTAKEKPLKAEGKKTPATPSAPLQQALAVGLASVLAAVAVLWVLLLSPSQSAHQNQLDQQTAALLADASQRAVRQLQRNTETAAQNPELFSLLQSNDRSAWAASERAMTYQSGVIDAYLARKSEARLDNQRNAPINYAALDMIRRTENGQSVAPEAYRIGSRWLVYVVAPVRLNANEPLQGTLLLAYELSSYTGLLPIPSAGGFALLQNFGKGPEQNLFQIGQYDPSNALDVSSGNSNWKLQYSAASDLSQALFSPVWLVLVVLLLIGGLLAATFVMNKRWLAIIGEDIEQLSSYLAELQKGKSGSPPALRLAPLSRLTQGMARLGMRQNSKADSPKRAAPKPAEQPMLIEEAPSAAASADQPLFQDADILDIDDLDDGSDFLGLNQVEPLQDNQPMLEEIEIPALPDTIFRAYDIRGTVGEDLTLDGVYWIGRAIGSESLAQGEPHVNIGRDGRLSSPELAQRLAQGLVDSGCQVTDVGLVPTPVLYFATHELQGKSGVMVTGSHNPPEYNGLKIVIAGHTLSGDTIQALHQRIKSNDLAHGVGSLEQVEILDRYFKRVRDDIALARPMKVVVDCGNGASGVIAPQLIEALGCTVIPLYCEVDGNFPNHHPDPGKPANLKDLIERVKAEGADIGLAFDGDGDRVGVVTNSGKMIFPDHLMMLFAKDVVSRNPGCDIIFDVKCSRRLAALISGYGGRPVMWKTGHSLIKQKMKETGALLAGEMSGHIFFKERWYGFDDGLYSAVRLLEILSLESRDADTVFAAFPSGISTPEINIQVPETHKFKLIEALQQKATWGQGNVSTLDGVRVDYAKAWGLVRASNTTPVLVLRFEGDSQEELERVQNVFREQLQAIAPKLPLPF